MNVQPVGFTQLRGGYIVPRVMAVTEPLIKRLARPAVPEPYDFITPKRGEGGQIPTLTLYRSDGKPDTVYFDPRFGRQPRTRAEAAEQTRNAALCETCRTRTYQDSSGDGNVSFKTPAHIAPQNSAAAVASHEREHVAEAHADARQNKARAAYSSVRLFTANCPECGRVYISGGLTETRLVSNPARLDTGLLGQYVDMAV
ncbi:MAG: hypothetical protein LBR76_01130 [Oscillospiraceae bacterium]|jgi:hypothetical protein|nr:hypothetical protein [Oscillospiraceae bacterium]